MKVMTLVVALLAVGVAADLVLIQPGDLAVQLATKSTSPLIFHVGPNVLYRGKHIPGAIYAGPASKPEGLEALKVAAGSLPRDRQIVVYCGCCPWSHCPNVKPAVELLKLHPRQGHVRRNQFRQGLDRQGVSRRKRNCAQIRPSRQMRVTAGPSSDGGPAPPGHSL